MSNIPEFRSPGDLPESLQWLREWIVQAALWKQMRDPNSQTVGDPLDKFLTRREAVRTGVLVAKPGGGFAGGSGGGGGGGGPIIITPPPQPYIPDLTPPPTPEGLTVTPGFSHLILRWNPPSYTQGRGHARTLIYGAVWEEGDPPPVFADAQLIDSAVRTNIHNYPTNPSTRWAIWIKWQSIDGGISTNPAGGANGAVATTGVDVDAVLAALTAAAMNPSAPYGVFTLRGDLINVADNAGNATDLFFLVTTPITINGQTVAPGLYLRNAWVHNGFITNAMMGRAIIDDAVINTISAAKFTGGEMRVDSFLQSTNFTPGPTGAGFRFQADGTAELQAAYIRGQLTAPQIDTTGLTIKDAAGNVILNAGATPSIGGGVVVTGTGGATLGALATGFVAAPIVSITGTGVIFVTPSGGGAPTPASHTLTANVQNIDTPVYQWLVDGVVQASTTNTLVVPSFPAGSPSKLIRVNVSKLGDPSVNGFDVLSVYSLQEGSDAYGAGLSEPNIVIAAEADGTVSAGQLPLSVSLVVVRGAAIVPSGVTYSVVSGTVTGLSGVSINSSGVITITGVPADVGLATFRGAVSGGPTFDRVLRVVKAKQGAASTAQGPQGLRGSITGFSNSVTPPVYASGTPWNAFLDNDIASILVWRMLGNAGNPPVGAGFNNHMRIGDMVTLSNTAGTQVATRIWNGTTWSNPGIVVGGDFIAGGTISGGTNLNIAGYARVEGGFGLAVVAPLDGSSSLVRQTAIAGNVGAGVPQDYGVVGYSAQSLGNGAGVYGYNGNSVSGGIGVAGRGRYGVYGVAIQGSNATGVWGEGGASGIGVRGNSVGGTGVRGDSSSSIGVIGISTSNTGVYGFSSAGIGGRFGGTVALRTDGPTVFEGAGSTLRFKPTADSTAGVGVVMRTDGGSFLLGITADGNANGSPVRNGLVYNLATGQMLVENLGQYGMTINAPNGDGYGLASFSGRKPGPGSTQEWERVEVNGRVGRRPIWFDDGPPP